MEEHRLSKRFNTEKACFLELGRAINAATVSNISFGGALVRTSNVQYDIHADDKCSLSIHGEFLRKYLCKVARVEPLYVALEFIK